jgi:hypothetical protein
MQQYLAYFKENFLMINGKVRDLLSCDHNIAWIWKDIPGVAYLRDENYEQQEVKDNVSCANQIGTDFFTQDLVFWCSP